MIEKTANINVFVLDKEVGETPLECLERFRVEQIKTGRAEFADLPMTYAGRLDPMASGKLLILAGEECKSKEKYLGLDKKYEVEVLFGIETDTQDVLGLICSFVPVASVSVADGISFDFGKIDLQKYVGKFSQPYPAYSSKTVDGKQLHAHAREGTLPDVDEMPVREVEIYSIEKIGKNTMTGNAVANEAMNRISKVTGDFRQKEIIAGWDAFAKKYGKTSLETLKIKVSCSGGTYMRSLAERIGKETGTGAIALLINRTRIGNY